MKFVTQLIAISPTTALVALCADGTVITERGVSPVDWEEKRLILLPL